MAIPPTVAETSMQDSASPDRSPKSGLLVRYNLKLPVAGVSE
jgi:hypothetical protein